MVALACRLDAGGVAANHHETWAGCGGRDAVVCA
jgi:hypothetical protein